MENLIPLNNKKVKQILTVFKEQFGYEDDNIKEYAFFLRRNDSSLKIITRDVIKTHEHHLNIDSMGLRIGKEIADGILLTIEGSQMLGPNCTKNIVELEYDNMRLWLKGFDIETKDSENKFIILKYNNDFLGSAKMKNNKILNNIPKARRLQCND